MQEVQQQNSEDNETCSSQLKMLEILPKDNTKALSKFCYKSATNYKIIQSDDVYSIQHIDFMAP